MDDISDEIRERQLVKSQPATQYVTTENLLPERGGFQPSQEYPVTTEGIGYKVGDILISNIRPYLKKIWLATHNGICSSDIVVIRPKSNVTSSYLYQLLSSDAFFSYVMSNAMGTKMPRGDRKTMRYYPVSFPNQIEVQIRITDALFAIDRQLSAIQQLLAKYESIKKTTVNLLLKPKVGWKQVKLGDIGEIAMCKRILKSQTSTTGDVPFYKIGTFGKCPDAFITHELFEDYKRRFSYPKVGDVLLSAAGTIGRTVVFNGDDAYFQDSNIVWIVNDESIVTNPFLNAIYSHVEWQTENGGTVSRLYNANILNTMAFIPQLNEQKDIVASLDSINTSINGLSSLLEKTQNLKQSMLQYFFGD